MQLLTICTTALQVATSLALVVCTRCEVLLSPFHLSRLLSRSPKASAGSSERASDGRDPIHCARW